MGLKSSKRRWESDQAEMKEVGLIEGCQLRCCLDPNLSKDKEFFFFFFSPTASSFWDLGSLEVPQEGPERVSSVIATCMNRTPHVSDSCPARGITNTVMSSPEPSLSLGSRQPRSFSTPRDLISRSCAASVYLHNTHTEGRQDLQWTQGHKNIIYSHIQQKYLTSYKLFYSILKPCHIILF